jgi:hypothetical protein
VGRGEGEERGGQRRRSEVKEEVKDVGEVRLRRSCTMKKLLEMEDFKRPCRLLHSMTGHGLAALRRTCKADGTEQSGPAISLRAGLGALSNIGVYPLTLVPTPYYVVTQSNIHCLLWAPTCCSFEASLFAHIFLQPIVSQWTSNMEPTGNSVQ